MRVLLVAPRQRDLLAVDAEVQDITRSGLQVTPLIGDVSASDLLRDIRTGSYDVLWLLTHGDGEYIELSGSERITGAELVPQVRGRFRLVILNTCSSLGIAQLIQEEANVGVICTLLDVPDTLAYKTGSRLASALAESPTVAAAYLASKPGLNRSYLYLPALEPAQDVINTLVTKIDNLSNKLEQELVLYRWLFWSSAALHIPEWIALVWLFTHRGS